MSCTMYTPLNVWLDPASVTDVVAYIQTYLSENTIYSETEIETIIHDYLIAHPELIGGVQSVNGKTGTVVLSASDINTANNVTIESVLASLSSQISSIAASVATNTNNITSLTGRVSTAETDLANLKSSFDGYQSGNLPITIIKNSYVNTNGQILPYNGWDRTDYIPVNQYYSIFVQSSVASGYNVFYDENKNKISDFLVTVSGATRFIPTNAAYVIFSNTAQGMQDLIARYNKAEMVPRKADNITTLLSLTNMGVYGLSRSVFANITDKPSDSDDAVATLINYLGAYADGRFLIQRLNQTSGKIWERIINTDSQTVSYDWKRIDVNSQNVLAGKKLVTAGDSYTAANWSWSQDYIQYDGKNFGYYIAQRNNMTFVNAGISGSTMAVPTNGEGHNPFVVDRYLNVPADADYLTIWFGINDAAYCTLGTIDDEVDNTFYGAWNKVLRYYLTNRPWLKILIIVTVMANPDIRKATRDIAKKWGYPYLDWEKDVSIPAFFMREGMSDEAKNLRRSAFGYNGPNEGHPNPQFYEYESTIIEAKLRSI